MSTRRDFLRTYTALFLAGTAMEAQPPRKLSARLAQEFRGAWLLDTSPDSQKLALYFTTKPIDKFTSRGGEWTYEGGPARDGKDAFEVVEMDSWRAQCSVRLRHYGVTGSFHADSRTVYVGTDPLPGDTRVQHVVIDLGTREIQEHMNRAEIAQPSFSYQALWHGALLVVERAPNLPLRLQSMLIVALPEYREITRVPFSWAGVSAGVVKGVVKTTDDRKFIAHTAVNYRTDQSKGTLPVPEVISNMVVFRRSENLEILWSRQIEAPNQWPDRIAVASDGRVVAVAVSSVTSVRESGGSYIEILNGNDGRQIAKLPVYGGDGIAVSPDGTVLAVGRLFEEHGKTVLAAYLYELPSMKILARVEHDRWSKGRDLIHATGFDNNGLQFTADGRYLMTSINGLVKAWKLDPHLAAE